VRLGPEEYENWEMVTLENGQRIFEVHRHFRSLTPPPEGEFGHMQDTMRRHGMPGRSEDWFSPEKRRQLLIIVGMDVTPFVEAI
jgi:hypothetical protein